LAVMQNSIAVCGSAARSWAVTPS